MVNYGKDQQSKGENVRYKPTTYYKTKIYVLHQNAYIFRYAVHDCDTIIISYTKKTQAWYI